MLVIFLKDRQKTIEFTDYPGDDSLKFMMNFKKIFPSTFDLLLPVLPDSDGELNQVTWESTEQDLYFFKKLIQEWATVELRLAALTKYKNQQFTQQLVKQAQQSRKTFQDKQQRLNLLFADYIFLQAIHTLLDAELIELGMQFYLPTLRQNWKKDIPAEVLNAKVSA